MKERKVRSKSVQKHRDQKERSERKDDAFEEDFGKRGIEK